MTDWRSEMESALDEFARVCDAIGIMEFPGNDVSVEYLAAPHRPGPLPVGTMAVYAFWWNGQWLKIGKAGPWSGARYQSQHYNLSAPSTLARSLVEDRRMAAVPDFDPAHAGEWVRNKTCRVNITMSLTRDVPYYLSFLEAFLHLRLHPLYEGHTEAA